MQGTRDSQILKEDHAYILFEVKRCSNKNKKEGDALCKPKKVMRLKDGSSDEQFPIETLMEQGADLTLYKEDLKADSIDNFTRFKKATLKIINQKIDFNEIHGAYAVRYNELYT